MGERVLRVRWEATRRFREVLHAFGVSAPRDAAFRIQCPIHRSQCLSFQWYPQQGKWVCFSGPCGQGDPIDFVRAMMGGVSLRTALDRLEEILGTVPHDTAPVVLAARDDGPLPELSAYELRSCRGRHPYWSRIRPETAQYVGAGYCTDTDHVLFGRITVPVYDEHDRLVGIVGRVTGPTPPTGAKRDLQQYVEDCWIGGPREQKYKFFGPSKTRRRDGRPCGGFRKGRVLYHYNRAQHYPQLPLIMAEGTFDVARVVEHGYHAVVGVFGSDPTKAQCELLTRVHRHLVYALDPDTFTDGKYERVLKRLSKYDVQISTLHLPPGVDLGDTDYYTFHAALADALYGRRRP